MQIVYNIVMMNKEELIEDFLKTFKPKEEQVGKVHIFLPII